MRCSYLPACLLRLAYLQIRCDISVQSNVEIRPWNCGSVHLASGDVFLKMTSLPGRPIRCESFLQGCLDVSKIRLREKHSLECWPTSSVTQSDDVCAKSRSS